MTTVFIAYFIITWIMGFLYWLLEMIEANPYEKVDIFWRIMFVPFSPIYVPIFTLFFIRGLLMILAEYLFLNRKK